MASASALLRGPQLRSGSEGRYPAPPRIEVPGRFFGAPWWPPPEACSVVLNCGLAARAGIPPLPNSAPRPLFWGALVASASVLLRGPQFRIAWLLVATETIVVRRNKYRFRILHIYAMKPITWQPSRIQTDGERQWAETVLCFIGGPRETVYSDCSLLDQRAKMSTSRKPRVKLAKHRRSARIEPEPEPAESSTAETQASTERGTVTARSALTGT